MKRFIISLVLTLGFATQASATPITGTLGGLGFYTNPSVDPLVFEFPVTMTDPSNSGSFAGITDVDIGNIVVDNGMAMAANWTIGMYEFIVDRVRVLDHDSGYDFILVGVLTDANAAATPFRILMETIPNGQDRGMYIFTSVPDPSALALIGLGIVGLIGVRRRQSGLAKARP